MVRPTLIFDMDGTLLDSRTAVVAAVADGLRRAYAHYDLPVTEPDRGLIEACMGLPATVYFERAFAAETVPPELHADFALAFGRFTTEREVAAIADGATALYPGVERTLSALRRRGHELLLFSNAGHDYFRAVVSGHGLGDHFSRMLCLEEAVAEGIAADKTGIVRALATEPATTIVVGDRAGDVAAGRAVGARTVGCLHGFGSREELQAADWLVDGLPALLELPLV